ncbi:P-loop NTPase [Desulforhopalus sp. IMCC35007]|uniref:P-loop NTPase n=1 Tax=Desulforhopalus sp. IMCC35007 TaxID=2569543 RepID=UPI0010AEB70B|nr:P-loop NTPase [Desulforhopalus sp. IMCC35007]TKB08144.1 MinD/ParA family protein [Desulforhopalus sp. IMCC35007]
MAIKISIGSGKGGVGKTMIIANLAMLLAKSGKRVCLVDLDIGGADAHILFGLFNPRKTLTDFITRKVDDIQEIAHTFYAHNGLQLIPGTGNTLQTANMNFQEKMRLLKAIDNIDADIVLLDVGAGTSYHALDFFMHSDIQICVTLPDPTSIMDLYNFLQLATIRKMLTSFLSKSEVANILKTTSFSSLKEVFELAEQTSPGSRTLAQEALQYFHPLLIVNRDSENGRLNKGKLKNMVRKYLGIEIPELGEIPEDHQVQLALKAFLPISELYPKSLSSLALINTAEKLAKISDLFAAHASASPATISA